jgi:hypothetical protein
MIRTQIQLTDNQMKKLKKLSADQGISVAELIRRSVDQYLRSPVIISDEERQKRALSITGKFHSGRTDISTNHDKYLDEIYGS